MGDYKKGEWEHLPIRPDTFSEFRRLKLAMPSDDAFVRELLRVYRLYKAIKEKKQNDNR
jgi:hypothetical protein